SQKRGLSIGVSFCMSIVNQNGFPFHVSMIAEALPKCLDPSRVGRSESTIEIAYLGNFRRLLCGCERAKHKEHSAKRGSKGFLIHHRMTRSALARRLGGIASPICLAAFRLTTNSNFVGCSTGRSAGLAPFRILST